MPKIKTINVLKFVIGDLVFLRSFPGTPAGRIEANGQFLTLIKETLPNLYPEDYEMMLQEETFKSNDEMVEIMLYGSR